MTRGLFISGTDTGVGKSLVACALVRALIARGLRVGVMKPCETGVGADGPLDAIALRAAAGAQQPLAQVCPAPLALPAAPEVAAAAAGCALDPAAWCDEIMQLGREYDFVIVEGAGGLLVPIAPAFTMADLARRAELPLLVVARTRLGTINHTRLTLESARARGLAVLGVVLSHADGPLTRADVANLALLRRELADQLVGEIPPLAPNELPREAHLDITRLLERTVSQRTPAR